MIVLATLGKGREIVVSRGELVEIGGAFRIPDIMRQSGAFLQEVGTSNKTKASDYENACRGTDVYGIANDHFLYVGVKAHSPCPSE